MIHFIKNLFGNIFKFSHIFRYCVLSFNCFYFLQNKCISFTWSDDETRFGTTEVNTLVLLICKRGYS